MFGTSWEGWKEPCSQERESPKRVVRRGEAGGGPSGNSQLVFNAGSPLKSQMRQEAHREELPE